MKVRVTLTVDINPDAWTLNYGCDRDEIRNDVRVYVEGTVTEQLRIVGVLNEE